MSIPLSWQTIIAIVGFIQNATIANGYNFDWKSGGEPYQVSDDNVLDIFDPTAFVVQDDDATDKSFDSGDASSANILIECYIPSILEKAQETAHQARDDLRRCIPRKTSGNLPKGAHGLRILSARILQKPEGLPFVVVQVRMRVALQETEL